MTSHFQISRNFFICPLQRAINNFIVRHCDDGSLMLFCLRLSVIAAAFKVHRSRITRGVQFSEKCIADLSANANFRRSNGGWGCVYLASAYYLYVRKITSAIAMAGWACEEMIPLFVNTKCKVHLFVKGRLLWS